ncbi:hypothetical protein Tco_0730433 [Tanacetum coccineum]|uniref:Holin n=1 Tax=Tanacetum coccineum TaxID=301880 RepID=A0ABQ4YSM8_9ASTR
MRKILKTIGLETSMLEAISALFLLLHKAGYITYLTVYGIVLQTIAQRADKSADEHNIRLGITLGAIVVNLAADLWALFLWLAPDWFLVLFLSSFAMFTNSFKCYNVLKSTFIWAYEKVVDATNYLIGKLSELIWGDQVESNAAPPPRASV